MEGCSTDACRCNAAVAGCRECEALRFTDRSRVHEWAEEITMYVAASAAEHLEELLGLYEVSPSPPHPSSHWFS